MIVISRRGCVVGGHLSRPLACGRCGCTACRVYGSRRICGRRSHIFRPPSWPSCAACTAGLEGRGEAHGIRGLWLVGVRAQHDPGTALSSLPCCPPVPTPLRCVCFGGGPISRPSLLSTTWVFQSWTGCLSGRRRRSGWRDSDCAAENQPTGSEWVMQARRLTNVHTGTEENAD